MRLEKIFNGIEIEEKNTSLQMEILGIASDSRRIKDGYIFVAIKGVNRDGNDYIDEAMSNGASVIVTDDPRKSSIPFIKVSNARATLAKMWNNYYGNPTKDMIITAITGTNGKTSCAYSLYYILRERSEKVGLVSTVQCLIGDEEYNINGGSSVEDISAAMTTPDPEVLYRIFAKMRDSGIKYVVMEASSHALYFDKLEGLNIYIGIFLNLSNEHLDFHKTMSEYFEAKKKLFNLCRIGIINIDCEYGKILANSEKNFIKFSSLKNSDYFLENIKISDIGCKFLLKNGKNKIKIESSLIGNFVPKNISFAVISAKVLGFSDDEIINGIKKCKLVSGRMERVTKNIYIDFAHTPYAMENVLSFFRKKFRKKKLKVLFGCGGNRDREKRSEMGKIASKYADEIILTSDNSRDESTSDIIKEIMRGIDDKKRVNCIENRKEAITQSIKKLKRNEILLLLGKGHENYEIKNNKKTYFSEKKIIEEALSNV